MVTSVLPLKIKKFGIEACKQSVDLYICDVNRQGSSHGMRAKHGCVPDCLAIAKPSGSYT